jgi:hypothetical protein
MIETYDGKNGTVVMKGDREIGNFFVVEPRFDDERPDYACFVPVGVSFTHRPIRTHNEAVRLIVAEHNRRNKITQRFDQ